MLPASDDCAECTPTYTTTFGTKAAFSTLPFVATFIVATLIAYRKIYPLLLARSEQRASKIGANSKTPQPATSSHDEPPTQSLARRIAAFTFSSTIALSTVLTELLLCEISNSFNPTARSVALQITVVSLLGLLVIAIPLLGIYSVVSRSGYKFLDSQSKGRRRLAWIFEFIGYAAFLFLFWTIGAWLPESKSIQDTLQKKQNVFQACLDRVGITGVALMALLAGFASVSATWHNFGPKPKLVSESDIARKETGLDATTDMMREKKACLQQVDRQISQAPPTRGWLSGVIGTFRGGNTELQARQTLEMEISGLETMADSLESSLTILRQRRTEQLRSTTALGRAMLAFQYTFAIYCVYRIVTTTITILRRTFSSAPNTDTDPITYAIALFARHIYPSLDQASWAQQISFLLSGAMLLASFSAVTQTFHLFSRFLPSLLHATRTNFALLISQISGMYVISSALMLRGMMPKEVGSVINGALGSGMLDPRWVQKWFDGFFICSVVLTAIGVFIGRSVGSSDLVDDTGWDGDIELGKRS
ncbi:hypothetical protein LTR70_008219 [Exophiala xenobiotica]|uniref:G protein-coupled receptor n=1 Tax=Lithohypha guttulata TaxID=1690604 RepID=A0ABR0K2C1_9EURO|nr:hypothetical protein LTR24_007787 [Lithohypha guttulata]KAK5312377.1 hypothetical protein LTR70_008219 [Exophiala xenobiotica]